MDLMLALDAVPAPVPAWQKPFRLAVGDKMTISGTSAVTGRIERGTVKVGDELELIGLRDEIKRVTVTGLETSRKPMDSAEAGDDVTIRLRGVQESDLKIGQVLAEPGSIGAYTGFEAEIYVLEEKEGGRHTPFYDGYNTQFYFRTTGITGRTRLPEGTERVVPGDSTRITAELIVPLALEPGTRLSIREGGYTVGMGTVIRIFD